MNQSGSNKKKLDAEEQKKVKPKAPEISAEPAPDGESQELMQIWQSEIHDLESQEFESLELAVVALIEKVLDRMQVSANNREETKEFLAELFSTDPAMQDEIKSILKIKNS